MNVSFPGGDNWYLAIIGSKAVNGHTDKFGCVKLLLKLFNHFCVTVYLSDHLCTDRMSIFVRQCQQSADILSINALDMVTSING